MEIFTIGHSTHTLGHFIKLLTDASVTAVADVRSSPFSKYSPHFNREELKESLQEVEIDYRFYGKYLGGRPKTKSLYKHGVADYEAMALTTEFLQGLDLVMAGAEKHRMALMCSEHDPLECHRCLLVGRALAERGIAIKHILSDGRIESQTEIENRLLSLSGRNEDDLFASKEDRLTAAYREHSKKVAYVEPRPETPKPIAAE